MRRSKVICLTGGGTAGHVYPHFPIIELLKKNDWNIFYIGSFGMEREIIEKQGIRYHPIQTGKLRRYLSVENFIDLFRLGIGLIQALLILRREKPRVVFSKGGFVAVPVAVAAKVLGIPVITHESDMTPGLANRIIMKFASQVVYTFPGSARHFSANAICTGTPIRSALAQGNRQNGHALCGFSPSSRPTLLVMGGSLGAQRLNEALLHALPELVTSFNVIHLTGKGKSINFSHDNYKSFEYVTSEMADLLAAADLVISRAGANSIFELLYLCKPMLLVPLVIGSRGDQVLNAKSFADAGWAHILDETSLTTSSLMESIKNLQLASDQMKAAQKNAFSGIKADLKIFELIEKVAI